jgi:hypothetical protein
MMLQTHAEAMESSTTVYHEFLLYYKAEERVVYGFVEGREDLSFYKGLIDGVLPSAWAVVLIHAGNRNMVFQLYGEFDWNRFPKKRICFFVDRDLSAYLRESIPVCDNLYVTDSYSIENDLANVQTLFRVLTEVLGITGISRDEATKIRDLFNKNLRLFTNNFASVMAQVIIWRRQGSRPNLDNIDPKKLFLFDDGVLKVRSEFRKKEGRLQHASHRCQLPGANSKLLRETEREFRANGGVGKYVRGKYILWYFVQFVLSLHAASPRFCSKLAKKPKARISLGHANALIVIGPRVRILESLRLFIQHNYIAYIDNYQSAA